MTDFQQRVGEVIARIPKGTTLSYSQVALRAGKPGAARAVVRALHVVSGVPWWRVVRADRTLAKEVALEQARRLRREGVRVVGLRIQPAAARRASQSPTA